MSLRNEGECGIHGQSTIDVPKGIDTSSTSNGATPTKQKDGTFRAALLPDAVKTSNQAASQTKGLAFYTNTLANKNDLENKNKINCNTSPR